MAKQGEIDYLRNLGEVGTRHAAGKPFCDPDCGLYLMEIGLLMSLLPLPPQKVLDLGCGTGWSSCIFARQGYEVTGLDIAADMIHHANLNKVRWGASGVRFLVGDYEEVPLDNDFDCAVFLDALHHAVDEEAALRTAYRALKPGGLCLTSEPGRGHARSQGSVEAVRLFNVTERDMPPARIIQAARQAGFTGFRVYPHVRKLRAGLYGGPGGGLLTRIKQLAALALMMAFPRGASGVVVMTKPA